MLSRTRGVVQDIKRGKGTVISVVKRDIVAFTLVMVALGMAVSLLVAMLAGDPLEARAGLFMSSLLTLCMLLARLELYTVFVRPCADCILPIEFGKTRSFRHLSASTGNRAFHGAGSSKS